jgi:hypothetical protein
MVRLSYSITEKKKHKAGQKKWINENKRKEKCKAWRSLHKPGNRIGEGTDPGTDACHQFIYTR